MKRSARWLMRAFRYSIGIRRAWRDTDSDARLRQAFRVFLSAGASYTLAAEQLALHFNTVKYRLGRALARRGRPITDDRFDVELALLLCHWYGDALLLPPAP
jgi:DNA-binding PucR family transcriptional regulator